MLKESGKWRHRADDSTIHCSGNQSYLKNKFQNLVCHSHPMCWILKLRHKINTDGKTLVYSSLPSPLFDLILDL